MTGEELYSHWTTALKKHYPPPSGIVPIFAERTAPPEPRAWAFLTDVERMAWQTLADQFDFPERELVTRGLGAYVTDGSGATGGGQVTPPGFMARPGLVAVPGPQVPLPTIDNLGAVRTFPLAGECTPDGEPMFRPQDGAT